MSGAIITRKMLPTFSVVVGMPEYVLLGRTGMGKSSLVNAVVGMSSAPAETDPFEPCTRSLQRFVVTDCCRSLSLVDLPGLAERRDPFVATWECFRAVLNSRRAWIPMYVTRLDERRMRSDELETIRALTETLGPDLWDSAVLVYTFAGNVGGSALRATVVARTRQVLHAASRYSKRSVWFDPIVIVDSRRTAWLPGAVSTRELLFGIATSGTPWCNRHKKAPSSGAQLLPTQ